ncbi:hypothetical protein ACN4EE_07795 [Geminocystis sp. CENA526]|uniref:hypothetical protein n=1 Tax=Geminocystis sp. CENA526 TaxID=1355871 RepID=UPI003D6F8475
MTQFQLFDNVKLTENISLTDGGIAPQETIGTIVEVFNNGEAYLVELFGNWVKYDAEGNFITANKDEKDAFMQTLAVETVYKHQMILTVSAREIMGVKEHLNALLETLPDNVVLQVRDFAEFLQQKQQLTVKN